MGESGLLALLYARPLRYQRKGVDLSMAQCRVCKANARCSSTWQCGPTPGLCYGDQCSAECSTSCKARRHQAQLAVVGTFQKEWTSVCRNEEEPRRRYARSCISLLSVPAVLSMRRTFSHTAMPTSHDQYQHRRQLSVSLVSTRARPLVLQSSRDQLSSL